MRIQAIGGNPNTQRICGSCQQLCSIEEMVFNKGRPTNICKICLRDRARVRAAKRLLTSDYGITSRMIAKRDAEWIDLYKSGFTSSEIANKYGATKASVKRQLTRHGITRKDGGRHVANLLRAPGTTHQICGDVAIVNDADF